MAEEQKPTQPPVNDMIPKTEYEKLVSDFNAKKKEADDLKKSIAAANEAKLKEQNQWQQIAEAKEKEANEYRSQNENLVSAVRTEKKLAAARMACEKLGMRPEAVNDLDMLDLKQLQVETTNTGKINILGAEKFAEQLKVQRPHWFADKTAAPVDGGSPTVFETGGAVTLDGLIAAEKEAKKTGDWSKYQKIHSQYNSQRLSKMNRR